VDDLSVSAGLSFAVAEDAGMDVQVTRIAVCEGNVESVSE
jgi:hypothetical protein